MAVIRLYKLKGRDVWNADTRHADGRRWQFSTREKDETAARAFAESKVSAEAGGATVEDGAPSAPRKAWADRLGGESSAPSSEAPTDGGAPGTAVPDQDGEGVDPTEDAELVADILAMAGTMGLQDAIARSIRRQTWREGKRVGHYEPGAPNEKCALGFQNKLRERLIVLFGHIRLGPWVGLGLYGIGVAVTMRMNSERVEDAPEKDKAKQPNGEAHGNTPAPTPAPRPAEDPEDFRRRIASRDQ